MATFDGDRGRTETGRALALVTPAAPHGGRDRPLAEFVAQLIACALHLPAYRQARRLEPARAAVRYGAPGRAVRPALDRSL